jgi:hypothetical protein
VNVEPALGEETEAGWCPHLAMLLRRSEDVAPTLASFYALGAKRGGWLFHRSMRGHADADRQALTEAGLDVAALEAGGRMAFGEVGLDITPEDWVGFWLPAFEDALARGFSSAWWARFPIGPDEGIIRRSVAYDRAWDEVLHGRPCVSLCLFIVGDLDPSERAERIDTLGATHDGVLVGEAGGPELIRTPSR